MSVAGIKALCVSHAERLIRAARRLSHATMYFTWTDGRYMYVVSYVRLPLPVPPDNDGGETELQFGQDESHESGAA